MGKRVKVNYNLIKYIIPSYKLVKGEDKKVILIADLHDYTKSKTKSEALGEAIKSREPDHIVIAGDNIQGSKWESERAIGDFARFIDDVSEAAPVFISQGNHDLVGINSSNKNIRMNNFKSLENVRPGKVYPLVNDKVFIDGFEIIGYTPSHQIIGKQSIQEHGLAHDMFIREYAENGVNPDRDDERIVEFVGHNPYLIAQSENGIGLEELVPVDVFLTGHVHNGYRRSSTTNKDPDRYLDKGYVEKAYTLDKDGVLDTGSINPLFFGKTNLCRGVVYIDDNSQKRILQLSNNHFYVNSTDETNKEIWTPIMEEDARNIILNKKLHALIITGGIRKFFGFDVPGDKPEITEVIYKGMRKK